MPIRGRLTRHGAYHSPWCDYTLACMQRAEVSNSDMARHLACPVGTVQAYMTGKVRPPLRLMHPWSRRLKLTIEETVKLQRLAFFSHTEPEVVHWLMAAEKMAADLRERLNASEQAGRKLAMELAEVRAQAAGDV